MAYRDRDDLALARAEIDRLQRKVDKLTKKQERKQDWKAWWEEHYTTVPGVIVMVGLVVAVAVALSYNVGWDRQAQNACQERAENAHCASRSHMRGRVGPLAVCACEPSGEYVVRWDEE